MTAVFFAAFFAASPAGSAETAGSAGSSGASAEENSGGGQTDEFQQFGEFDEAAPSVYDPLMGYNRVMTRVNDRLYFWVLKPVARGYGAVVPEPARRSVNRFFKNLGYPVRLVNNLLQAGFRDAAEETLRFGINTTVGIAGLFDPAAKWWDLSPHPEDFGQSLGCYGVNGGFHFVLPVLGPSNFRDALARVPDAFLNPVYYVDDTAVSVGATVLEKVNRTSLRIGEYESLRKDALDMYILFRNAYEQNRKEKIEE
ncbi:MAG: VacJ family lipoprotein [Desulfosalsimonadaceae bacterium]